MESYIDELKNKTLYDALRETDRLNKALQANVGLFNDELHRFVNLPGYEDISIEQIPKLNIPEIQRELIEVHRNNQYLNQVLEGKNSFVNIVTELHHRKHKGWRSWFPIRKDEEYNKEIKEFDEILKTGFETTFISELVKPVSSFALFSLVGLGLGSMPLLEHTNYMGIVYCPLIFGILTGLVTGGFVAATSTITNQYFFQNEAEYLDKKVEDLMK